MLTKKQKVIMYFSWVILFGTSEYLAVTFFDVRLLIIMSLLMLSIMFWTFFLQ
jgi:hypothetical protein